MSERRVHSILAVDIGGVHTRALLFERLDGAFRLVGQGAGQTTLGAPNDDARAGLAPILADMSETSGRRIVDGAGRVIRPARDEREGVDHVLITTSAGPPLRAALLGLYPQVSIASARRVIAPFYIEAVAEVHLEDGFSARGRLNRIVHSRPQLIFIAGGVDGGAGSALLEMLAITREAVTLLGEGSKPVVLYAGASGLAASLREMLSQRAEVLIAPNIRQPEGEALEPAQALLGRYFASRKRKSAGYQSLASVSSSGILPTARMVETMTAFFGRSLGEDALTIDVGSGRTMLSLARRGGLESVIRNDIGVGHSAATALELIGAGELARWLPFRARAGELAAYALRKSARPQSNPLDMRARFIEHALLRGAVAFAAGKFKSLDRSRLRLVVLAGATFCGAGQGALDMLLLADALELDGVTQVKADPRGALPALGALASVAPAAVVQLVNSDLLEPVGALIRVTGRPAAGALALRITAIVDGGDALERDIKVGDVWHLPVPAAGAAELRIQASRGLSIGGKRRLRLTLAGGRGGLLFDARLDAQARAKTMTERGLNLLRWHAAVTGPGRPVAIPESWLAGPE